MDLGFAAAGFRVIFAADFNPATVETYRHNLRDHVEQADLTTLDPARIPEADVWVAGPPCQPYSMAGKRHGAADPRDLWPCVLGLLEAKRPPFAVFENVRGLLSWNAGERVHDIECALRRMGYTVTRTVLDAADFGVPQRRHRVFFLCRLGGPAVAPPWPTYQDPRFRAVRGIFDPESRRPWVTVRQALGLGGAPHGTASSADRPAFTVTSVEGKGASPADVLRHRKAGAMLAWLPADEQLRIVGQRNATEFGHGMGASVDQPSVVVDAGNPPRWAGPQVAVASKRQRSAADLDTPSVTVAADGRDALVALPLPVPPTDEAHPVRRCFGVDPRSLLDAPSATIRAGTHGQGGWSPRHRAGYVVDPDGPAPTLFMGGQATERSPGGGGVHQWSVADDDPHAGAAPSQTIDSSGEWHRPGRHSAGEPSRGPHSPTYLRRLTVREAARLQAFPDWFCFAGSMTARYAQVGNAVPPLLAWHVANAVRAAMGLPAMPVPDVLDWYASDRPEWAAGEGAQEDAEPGRPAAADAQ